MVNDNMIINQIIKKKQERLEIQKQHIPYEAVKKNALDKTKTDFEQKDLLSGLIKSKPPVLIAEVKKASPSKGVLTKNFKPVELAKMYEQMGARAVSVLTEEDYFLGKNVYLAEISKELTIPTLRKDFIFEPYQIYESKLLGAGGVLLITGLLDDGLMEELYSIAKDLKLTPLLEISKQKELERALRLNPELIGINNRDFSSFETDIENTKFLIKDIPNDIFVISESGIRNREDVEKVISYGASGVLVGESIVKSRDPAKKIQELSYRIS